MSIVPEPHPKEFRDDVVAMPARVRRRSRISRKTSGSASHACGIGWPRLMSRTADDPAWLPPTAELRELKRRNRLLEQENEVLRRAAAYLSQANLRGQLMYPLVRELAVDGISVTVTCQVLLLARQPYYRWLVKPIGDRDLERAYLANAVIDAHLDDPELGYRLLADEVRCRPGRVRPDGVADLRGQPVAASAIAIRGPNARCSRLRRHRHQPVVRRRAATVVEMAAPNPK